MSGGSYSYLFNMDVDELMNATHTIDEMVTALSDLGALDAAKETEEIKLILNNARVRVEARMDRLRPVMRAVEWWASGDSARDSVDGALNKYREGLK